MNVTEELLDLKSLKGQTRGMYLFISVCEAVDDMKLPWNNVSGIIIDGAPAWLVSEADCPHGSAIKSAKKQYETHKLRRGRGSSATFYPVVFNDIMGLEEGTNCGADPDDIKLAMKGHVMEGHKFNPVAPLSKSDPGYNTTPAPDDQVHLLLCVLSANSCEIKDSVLEKMNSVRKMASNLGIPQMMMITKIDQACPQTEKDLKNVYKSRYLKKKMEELSSEVGIPMNCIFPVKNYHEEIDLNEDVDTLILSALKHIIEFGDDFIEKLNIQVKNQE